MIVQYGLYALALVLGGLVAPAIGWRLTAKASRSLPPSTWAWRVAVTAGEVSQGALWTLTVAFLAWTWADPFTAVLHAAVTTGCIVLGTWWTLDRIGDPTVLIGAIGRAKGDARMLEAERQGNAVRWALAFSGSARVAGSIGAVAAVFALALRG